MPWFRAAEQLAVEVSPSAWRAVAAARTRESTRQIKAWAHFTSEGARAEDLREFRVRERLPFEASVILWPHAEDRGVCGLDERPRSAVTLPKARVIRERLTAFVRGGGRARDVLLPHEAAGRLAALAGWTYAGVLLLEPNAACIAVVDGDEVAGAYLSWSSVASPSTEHGRLLAPYQFAARLVPHLRGWSANGAGAVLAVCGHHPDLRSAVVPIVEELDQEIDVLDGALVGGGTDLGATGHESASYQLAWAVAAAGLR